MNEGDFNEIADIININYIIPAIGDSENVAWLEGTKKAREDIAKKLAKYFGKIDSLRFDDRAERKFLKGCGMKVKAPTKKYRN